MSSTDDKDENALVAQLGALCTAVAFLQRVAEVFPDYVRPDIVSKPCCIEERPTFLTTLSFGTYVNHDNIKEIAADIRGTARRHRKGRPSMTMVNAVSGAGKSALLQGCENDINSTKEINKTLALAINYL